MINFPELLIIRYYEDWILEYTHSEDWSQENIDKLFLRLDKEMDWDNNLEAYDIIVRWEWVRSEEKRQKDL